jgi:hypothetical protein
MFLFVPAPLGNPSPSPGLAALRAIAPVLLLFAGLSLANAAEPSRITKNEVKEKLGITRNLSCQVRKGYPVTLFDFQIHSPYRVSIPTTALKQSQQLNLRLWAQPYKDEGGSMFQPPRDIVLLQSASDLQGMAVGRNNFLDVAGSVATGAGEYRYVLSIDDGQGLGCVTQWDVKAKVDGALLRYLTLKPGEVVDPRGRAFDRQRPVAKQPDAIRVAVFLNADSRSWRRVLNDSSNMVALASSLRKVAEDPRVAEVAVTVFSLEDQKVLFDEDFQSLVSFRRVGAAFRQLKPGLVEFTDLVAKSEARFLAGVLRDREDRIARADLLLFLGARSPVTDKLSPADRESIPPRRDAATAYLVTNPFQWRSPIARDVIGHIVKNLNGREREIRLPEDLAKAVDGVLNEARRQRDLSRRDDPETQSPAPSREITPRAAPPKRTSR